MIRYHTNTKASKLARAIEDDVIFELQGKRRGRHQLLHFFVIAGEDLVDFEITKAIAAQTLEIFVAAGVTQPINETGRLVPIDFYICSPERTPKRLTEMTPAELADRQLAIIVEMQRRIVSL